MDAGTRPAGALRLLWLHVRIGAQNEAQYRANFWLQMFNSLIALGVGLAAIALVYRQTEHLAGWERPELLAVMGVHLALAGVLRAFILPNMSRLMEDVMEGTLDYALTRPADAQLLVSVRDVSLWNLVDVVIGLGVVTWAAAEMGERVSIVAVLAFLVAATAGMVVLYCLYLSVTTLSFRVIRAEEMLQLLEGLYESGRWPVTIYPTAMRATLTFVVPLAFAITLPAEVISARASPVASGWAVLAAVVAATITRRIWRWGIRNYSGASA
jgi:ABC-2 type transport system permease protein